MQITFKKNLFFFLWVILIPLISNSQGSNLTQIDSTGKLSDLTAIDNKKDFNMSKDFIRSSKNQFLKKAFDSEKSKNYVEVLYFLSLAYIEQPDINLLNKISDVAEDNSFEGYKTDDWGFVFLLFKNYFYYIYVVLFLLGVYVFSVSFFKFTNKQFIPVRHKWSVLIYMIAISVALNLPKSYSIGIVSQKGTILRSSASSSGPIVESIKVGNKINIVGQRDIWFRVLWHKKLFFVRKVDVSVIY